MATPKQNYARQYQAYAQSIEPDIPSSVRTYSIFNPDTGTWQRMTNNFRSPIPVQGQTLIPTQTPGIMLRPRTQVPPMTPEQEQIAIEAGLARARTTQGTTYQPLPQTPAQRSSRGSRTASPASGGGTVIVPMDQPKAKAPAGSQVVPTGNPYMGYAESRREFEDPDAFLHETPRGTAGAQGQKPVIVTAAPVNLEEVSQIFQPPMDRGYQFNEPVRRPPNVRQVIDEEYNNIPLRLHQAYGLMGGGLNVGPALASFRAGDASVAAARKAYQEGMMRSQLRRAAPSKYTQIVHPEAPTIEAVNRFSPMSSTWSPPQGTVINRVVGTPSGSTYVEKLALEAPVYPRYAYPPKPASIPNVVSRADINRASQAAENALKGRYSNVGGGLSAGKAIPRATVRLNTGDTSSIWANAGKGFQRYQILQQNPNAFDPSLTLLERINAARNGIPFLPFTR